MALYVSKEPFTILLARNAPPLPWQSQAAPLTSFPPLNLQHPFPKSPPCSQPPLPLVQHKPVSYVGQDVQPLPCI